MCEDLTLSEKEALTFFNDKLAIHDVHSKISKSKIDLLNEVATNWLVYIPFQDLTQLSKSKDNKAIGNLKTVVGDILTGVGGLCFHHNLALYLLLKALEFDVYLAASAVLDTNKVDHVVVIVRNLQRGRNLYLMDVGCGVPCFSAVPLDFEESSVVFKEAYLTYKYIKVPGEDGLYSRMHMKLNDDKDDDEWNHFYYLWIKEESIDYIKQNLDEHVFRNMEERFNNYLYLAKYPDRKLVCLRHAVIMIENQNGVLEKTDCKSWKEIMDFIERYFPEIPDEVVKSAVAGCSTVLPE